MYTLNNTVLFITCPPSSANKGFSVFCPVWPLFCARSLVDMNTTGAKHKATSDSFQLTENPIERPVTAAPID